VPARTQIMQCVSSRQLGRSRRPVPLLLWRLSKQAIASPEPTATFRACAQAGAAAFFIPADLPRSLLERLGMILAAVPGAWQPFVGLLGETLEARGDDTLADRLATLGMSRCRGIVVEEVSSAQIKAGRVFHRLMRLRDRRLTELFLLDTENPAEAQWMLANTPAHGVCVPYGLLDQTIAFGVLAPATELGMAIVATPVTAPRWLPPEEIGPEDDLAFVAGEAAVASIMRPFPQDEQHLQRMLRAVCQPMPEGSRARWWASYQAAVPAPPKLPRHLPPDLA
jgi:hypothetical protein